MSRLRSWRWRIAILAAIAIASYAVVMFVLIESSDANAKRIVEQLQPGLADAQVQQILAGIRHYKGKVTPGDDAYVFYGVDEFVYIVMEKSGGKAQIRGSTMSRMAGRFGIASADRGNGERAQIRRIEFTWTAPAVAVGPQHEAGCAAIDR